MNKGNERLANLVDEGLELTDPHPDIHELFRLYDHQFFSGTLSSRACTVEWSKRMTSCAGICQFRKGFCCIRLSEPLLTLRRRKDLVETLLHEMIHGYLFLTGGFRFMDRDGHGPEFQFHMHRINSLASTSITIYHSFHAEVSHYKQHWWRCTGPCQEWAPYFGWVKRATNRAPGPYDIWWKGHEMNCNGSFVKVKEPEKKAKVTKSKTSASDGPSTSNSNNNQQKTSKRKKPIKAQIDPKQPKIDQLFPGKGHVLGGFKNIAVAAEAEHKGEDDDDITIIAQVINNRPQLDQIDNKPLPFLDKAYRLGY